MAQAYYHARSSARKFGGIPEDYINLHKFLDQTKAHLPDARHRMLLHNSFGVSLGVQIFGDTIVVGDGIGILRSVPTQTILEQHILEDFGFIPTLEKCFSGMPIELWMASGAQPLSIKD